MTTTSDIELAVFDYFNQSQNTIIPNVRWGWRGLNYEIDVMIITRSMYAYEIEIKTSAEDLKRDFKKDKWAYCRDEHYFRKSYYAIPEALRDRIDIIPEYAGVLIVSYNERRCMFCVSEIREPQVDAYAKKVTEDELIHFGYLASLRMWILKRSINRRQALVGSVAE